MVLCDHITNNALNLQYINIKQNWKTFYYTSCGFYANIPIKRIWKIWNAGSIANVPTNVNLVQTILLQLPCDDCSITVLLKTKSEYKSIYMLGYVRPNMMMKTL
jgi:hypothetical protein